MLIWIQGSLCHIAAGSHPVQEAWGSQDSLYRGQIQKLRQCCQKPYQQIRLVQKKYSLTYLRRTFRSSRSEVKSFGSTGVKQVKMPQFCGQWSQNARLVTFQIQNNLLCVACYGNMVMQ